MNGVRSTYSALTNDSRKVGPGTLFFCIRGTQTDGHDYIAEVNAKGAKAVVVEDAALSATVPNAIVVKNTREAYALACADWFGHPSQKIKVVAVTGTNGKTTTTFLTSELLERWGWSTGLIGTVQYRTAKKTADSSLTTPDAWALQENLAAMVDEKMRAVAIEASSIALDQHRLTGTQIEVAVFSNLTQDHLDYHHTWENYFEAKVRLFTELRPKAALVNWDDPWGKKLVARLKSTGIRLLTFSASGDPTADLRASECKMTSQKTVGRVTYEKNSAQFELGLIGQHNIANALAASGAALLLGMPFDTIVEALSTLKGAPGRLERVPLPNGAPRVFVDYAHSPDALVKVTETLRAVVPSGGKLITVFGAGGDRDKTKRPLMAKAVAANSDVVIITSDNPRTEPPESIIDGIVAGMGATPYHREADRKRAIALALRLATPSDLILVAGKGHETYQIVGTEKRDFDDRFAVSDAYFTQNGVLR